jgi:hypothetical protein
MTLATPFLPLEKTMTDKPTAPSRDHPWTPFKMKIFLHCAQASSRYSYLDTLAPLPLQQEPAISRSVVQPMRPRASGGWPDRARAAARCLPRHGEGQGLRRLHPVPSAP